MGEGGFNELELLSQEDLIVETLRKLLRAYAELSRRDKVTSDFLESLCDFSIETRIWFDLWESGGAQRFTDILQIDKRQRSTLSGILRVLLRAGLIRKVEKRYQAVSPAWLVRKIEPNRRKL